MYELLGERYRLGTSLGFSGSEETREAWDSTRKSAVCVRLATVESPDAPAGQFVQAAESLEAISTPHLVTVRDHGEGVLNGSRVRYIVFDRVAGVSLEQRMKADKVSLKTLVTWTAELCEALAGIHLAGLVHGDLSPANVIVSDTGSVTLLAPAVSMLITELGTVSTAEYAPPEVASGPGTRGPASDLYSLGCLLYYLTTGVPPFMGKREEVLRDHRESTPVPAWRHAPFVPQRLDLLIRELLTKAPDARPGDAHQVAARLREIAGGPLPRFTQPPSRSEESEQPETLERTRDSKLAGAAAAITIGAVVAGAVWTLFTLHTTLNTPTIIGVIAVALILVPGIARITIAIQQENDFGVSAVGCAVALAIVVAFVLSLYMLPYAWWIRIPVGILIAVGSGMVLAFGYALSIGAPLGILNRYGYPRHVGAPASAAASIISVSAAVAVVLSEQDPWPSSVLWALGAWPTATLVLAALLLSHRTPAEGGAR